MTDTAALDAADPTWLAHRYALAQDAVVYRHVPRDQHARVPFLTDEYLGDSAGEPASLRRPDAVAAAPAGVLHFLFHSAFCNSTLLVRGLDHAGVAMGLSEPVILNDIVGIRRRRELDAPALGKLTADALMLLGRPWGAGEATVVKPSNIVNPIASALLALRPDARAVLLYAPLALFLNSVARKGLWCRLWVRELAEGLLRDGVIQPLGITAEDLFRQSDLQVAAVGWLAQQRLFAALHAQFGAARIATLDSETLTKHPADVLRAVGQHYGLAIDAPLAERMAGADAFARHSKSGVAFSAADRAAAQAATAAAHGEEIAQVVKWAEVVAGNADVALTLPGKLLG